MVAALLLLLLLLLIVDEEPVLRDKPINNGKAIDGLDSIGIIVILVLFLS